MSMEKQARIARSRAAGRPDWLAWGQLIRLPNVFTAWADVLMGFLLTHASLSLGSLGPISLLLLATTCFYCGGMVLNDLCDIDSDIRNRRRRPISTGRISPRAARNLCAALFAVGLTTTAALTILTSRLPMPTALEGAATPQLPIQWRPLFVGALLTGCIWGYNTIWKPTSAGPLIMGACRALNVILGMTLVRAAWADLPWGFALGIGVFVAGITWTARRETQGNSRRFLVIGGLLMAAGITIIAQVPMRTVGTGRSAEMVARWSEMMPFVPLWALFWLFLLGWLGLRSLRAIENPSPENIKNAVRWSIGSIIVIDAAITVTLHGRLGIVLILLLIPLLYFSRRIDMT